MLLQSQTEEDKRVPCMMLLICTSKINDGCRGKESNIHHYFCGFELM